MKFTTIASLVSLALAGPVPHSNLLRRGNPTEIQILNYALTLEHLESSFYYQFLGQFNDAAFAAAGFDPSVRGRLSQIAQHEWQHVQFLMGALGNLATQPCQYKFPVTDPASFLAVSAILEGVGVTAYLGAAQYLTTPAYLTAAGSILTTEARHNAWVNSVAEGSYPWNGPMDTPQTLNQVYSLAAAFITSCPANNPALPVMAFPSLTAAISGTTATLTYAGSKASGQYLALLTGLKTEYVPIVNGKVTLSAAYQGTVYALVSSNGTSVTDASTVAGPAIMTFPFAASASQSGYVILICD